MQAQAPRWGCLWTERRRRQRRRRCKLAKLHSPSTPFLDHSHQSLTCGDEQKLAWCPAVNRLRRLFNPMHRTSAYATPYFSLAFPPSALQTGHAGSLWLALSCYLVLVLSRSIAFSPPHRDSNYPRLWAASDEGGVRAPPFPGSFVGNQERKTWRRRCFWLFPHSGAGTRAANLTLRQPTYEYMYSSLF